MSLIAIRRGLPPGFTELAADHALAATVGTECFGALLRLAHLATPSADVPGSWVIDHTRQELASHLQVGYGKVAKLLEVLVTAGALAADPGMRLGRGMGSTNTRYFLTAIPGLTAPPPRRPTPSRTTGRSAPSAPATPAPAPAILTAVSADGITGHRSSDFGTFEDGGLHSPRLQVSPHEEMERSGRRNPDTLSELTDEDSSHDPENNAPNALLQRNLTRLGWDGPPPAGDATVIALVAGHLAGRTDLGNRAGYLNRLIRNNDLERYAAERGLVTPAQASGSMSSADYVRYRDRHPQWADQVRERAEDLAAARGVPVRMALLCEAATEIPLPTQAGSETSRTAGGAS